MKFCKIYLIVIAYILSVTGCDTGIQVRYLTTPDGVVADISEITPSQFLPLSQALFAAKNQPYARRVELAQVDDQLGESLDSAQSILGAAATKPAKLKVILNNIRLRENKDDVKDHITTITELTKSLALNGTGQKLVTELKVTKPDLSKEIDKALRTRLIMEMNLTECSGLYKPLANAARESSDHAEQALDASIRDTPAYNRAELMKDALAFLESLDDCPAFSAGVAQEIHKSLSDIIKSSGVMKNGTEVGISKPPTYQDAGIAIETKMVAAKNAVGDALTSLKDGIYVLNLAKNPWLKQVPIPEAYDGPDLKPYYQFPTDLVEAAFVKNTAPLVLSLPSDTEIKVYEQFFALKGDTVRTLDLIKLSETAHALRLTAGQFIDWIHEILTKMAASGKNPWVFVHGIGALDYEPYSDASARKHAMAQNVERMLKNVAGVKLVVPVTKEHNFVFTESPTVFASRRVQVPLNLEVAHAIVKELITLMPPSRLMRATPLMVMAKALRALDPEGFFLSDLMAVLHAYEQEVTARTPIDEMHVALSIAAEHLAIKPNRIEESRALAYTPGAIEAMLLANPTTFSKASLPSIRSDYQMRADISRLRSQMQNKANNEDVDAIQEMLRDEINDRKNALASLTNKIDTLKNDVDANIDNLKDNFKNQQSTVEKELTTIKNELNLQKNNLADLGNTHQIDVQKLKNKNIELEKMLNRLEKEIAKKADEFSFTNLKNDLNTKFTDTKNQLETMAKKEDVKNRLKNIVKDTNNDIEKVRKELELSLKTGRENISKLKENIKKQRDEIDNVRTAQRKDSQEIREELNNTKKGLENEIAKKAGKDELTKLGNEVQNKLDGLQDFLLKKINEKLSSEDFDTVIKELKSSLKDGLTKTQDALGERIDTLGKTVNDNEKRLSTLENLYEKLDKFIKDMKNEIDSELKDKLGLDVFLNYVDTVTKQFEEIVSKDAYKIDKGTTAELFVEAFSSIDEVLNILKEMLNHKTTSFFGESQLFEKSAADKLLKAIKTLETKLNRS